MSSGNGKKQSFEGKHGPASLLPDIVTSKRLKTEEGESTDDEAAAAFVAKDTKRVAVKQEPDYGAAYISAAAAGIKSEGDEVMKQETDDEEETRNILKPKTGGKTDAKSNETADESGTEKYDENSRKNGKENGKMEVNVEFKFRSCKTHLLQDGEWEGVFHLKMMQDQQTGKFSLLDGNHEVEGKLTKGELFSSDKNLKGEIIKSGSRMKFKLGADLTVSTYKEGRKNEVEELMYPSGSKKDGLFWRVEPFINENEEKLEKWMEHQGGMLSFLAHLDLRRSHNNSVATYKLKFYTVLSAHIPNKKPRKARKGRKIDWHFLEEVFAAHFPDKGVAWAKRAVFQYKLFLELKVEHGDWNSRKFSPSNLIDEVWHAHISFIERYQRDVGSLTGNKHLIEHSPVLAADARERYKAAFEAHTQRMSQKNESVDSEFWPSPKSFVQQDSLNDMDRTARNDGHLSPGLDDHLELDSSSESVYGGGEGWEFGPCC